MKWSEGHERPFEDYVHAVAVLLVIAGIAYGTVGWFIVLPPEVFGYDRELA